jgi:osmoprotectant transport system permease protein
VDEGERMSPPVAVFKEFGDALKFLVQQRESVTGGAKIGGHEIWLQFLPRHLLLTGVSVSLACAIAIPLALWLGHLGRGEVIATSVANVGRAVPSLALIAIFVAYLGVGFTNVTLALVLLAIPPILTNTYVGVRQVDPDVVDAARGMGMAGAGIVRRVELPLALPLIFSGVRTSVVNVVATATIAPLAGYITLGSPIIEANVYGEAGRLGASIVVAVLAVACELAFGALERAVTPRGLKLRAGSEPRRRAIPFPHRRAQATS